MATDCWSGHGVRDKRMAAMMGTFDERVVHEPTQTVAVMRSKCCHKLFPDAVHPVLYRYYHASGSFVTAAPTAA